MDGVVGLTQCAIGPSKSFTYKFKLDRDQVGTFWYESETIITWRKLLIAVTGITPTLNFSARTDCTAPS
jgi:hypothetical protein